MLKGGLEGLDPPAGSRGGAPGGGAGAKPLAGCAWSVRDCSGNPAGSVLPPLNGRGTTVSTYQLFTVYLRWLPRNWSEKPDPGALRRGNARYLLNKYDEIEWQYPPATLRVKGLSTSVKKSLREVKERAWESVGLITIIEQIADGIINGDRLGIEQQVENLALAMNLARASLNRTNRGEKTFEASFVGTPDLVAGKPVLFNGYGKFDGKYLIERSTHSISQQGYTTTVEGWRCLNQ